MYEKLIRNYVDRVTINDVDSFSKTYGIILNEKELNLIFKYVKNDWHTIIYGNPRTILDDLKKNLDSFSYSKIEQLYIHFKEKYKNYL